MRDWLIAADDRTGALEIAALTAEALASPVELTVGTPGAGSGVVDLGTRLLAEDVAGEQARAIDGLAVWQAHKIDSMLRGNWAAEVTARQHANPRPVVLLPAWPALGRVCVNGDVLVDGAAVGRPADSLPGAVNLAGTRALAQWLAAVAGGGEVVAAVCDVADDQDLAALAEVLAARTDVLVVGPSGALGAVFARRFGRAGDPDEPRSTGMSGWTSRRLSLRRTGPIVVVNGSVHPMARAQVERVRQQLVDVIVYETPAQHGALNGERAVELANLAAESAATAGLVVVVGGDTAAAVLGSTPRLVHGTVALGMPISAPHLGDGPAVVTKAGSFGHADSLVDVIVRCRSGLR